MTNPNKTADTQDLQNRKQASGKLAYHTPVLEKYGFIASVTGSAGSGTTEKGGKGGKGGKAGKDKT